VPSVRISLFIATRWKPLPPRHCCVTQAHRYCSCDPYPQRPLTRRGYVVRLHHRYYALIRQSGALSPISYYRLIRRVFVIQGQILTAHQTFPNLLCASFSTCRHPYPGESLRCICLLLHEAYQPSPNVQRFGTRFPAHAIFHWFSRGQPFSRGCNVRFMLRPVELFAPLRWPPLLSRGSGAFTSELSRIWSPAYESDIATWVNRQFPGRDFHPLETQHYGLRTYPKGQLI
jgi:hypothetical protein